MPGIADKRLKMAALDRELMFALYLRLNTYDAVSMRLEKEGMINPSTGKRFARNSIRTAIMDSKGYEEWWAKRERRVDPLSTEITQDELDAAKKVIEERMPIQKDMWAKYAAHIAARYEQVEE